MPCPLQCAHVPSGALSRMDIKLLDRLCSRKGGALSQSTREAQSRESMVADSSCLSREVPQATLARCCTACTINTDLHVSSPDPSVGHAGGAAVPKKCPAENRGLSTKSRRPPLRICTVSLRRGGAHAAETRLYLQWSAHRGEGTARARLSPPGAALSCQSTSVHGDASG